MPELRQEFRGKPGAETTNQKPGLGLPDNDDAVGRQKRPPTVAIIARIGDKNFLDGAGDARL